MRLRSRDGRRRWSADPDSAQFFARETAALGFTLPAAGEYGVGMVFLPVERHERLEAEGILERIIREEGLTVLGWRDTPIDIDSIGRVARASQPYIEQIFVGREESMTSDELERKLYIVRKRAEIEVPASEGIGNKNMFYIPSLSSRTIVYKGLLLAPQIAKFYRELSDPELMSALCLVHQRFSTNTFPHLATGASVSLCSAQRGNQHRSRQH
jgi:glutamate synthase (NADPH/NADH) large chain